MSAVVVAPVVKTIRVQADQRKAFEVFTGRVGRWWAESCSASGAMWEDVLIEPYAGGRWYERGTDGSETVWGKVLAWEAPERLLVEWYAGADWPTEVDIRFTAVAPGVTELRLEHRMMRGDAKAAEWRGKYEGGWGQMLAGWERELGEAIVVHTFPGSPYGRAVLMAMEEKGIAYRLALLGVGEAKAEPHLSLHPFGRVPAIEHGGFRLYETQAILRYVDRLSPTPPLAPTELRSLARMDQVMNVCDWYLMRGVNDVIGFHRIVAPRLFGAAPDEAAIAAAMPQAHQVMGVLARTLGTKPFLVSDGLTLADILCATHLDFLSMTPEWGALIAAAPALGSWLERVRGRASFAATGVERLMAA